MALITVCEYADGLFPRRTKNPRFPVLPPVLSPVGWEVHQGGFRPAANNLEIIELMMMNWVLMVLRMLQIQ
jgi:hypothetical protein